MQGHNNNESGPGRRRTEGYMPLEPGSSSLTGQLRPVRVTPVQGSSDGGRVGQQRARAAYPGQGQDILEVPTRISVAQEPEPIDDPDLTLGFAAGRAAAARLRQALQGVRGAATTSSSGGGGGGGGVGSSQAGGARRSLDHKERDRPNVLQRSLEWIPAKLDRKDLDKSKGAKGAKGAGAGGRSVGTPGQILQRQRDKFVPLPFVASELGPLDELCEATPEASEADLAAVGLYHSLPEQGHEGFLSSLAHNHELMPHDSEHRYSATGTASPTAPLLDRVDSTPPAGPLASVPTRDGIAAYRGRLTVYCVAESLDRKALTTLLQRHYKSRQVHTYADVVHLSLGPSPRSPSAPGPPPPSKTSAAGFPIGAKSTAPAAGATGGSGAQTLLGPVSPTMQLPGAVSSTGAAVGSTGSLTGPGVADAFFFDYGVIVCWGLDEQGEKDLVKQVGKVCEVESYLPGEVEVDEFQFHFSSNERPHIKNDVFTINRRQATDHQVRLAISHALAQSAKLSVYEERVVELADETRDLPEALAECGKVNVSSTKVAKLIGKVFLQSSTVNLLSTVLDTPQFFWSAPDSLQALYDRACEYLELEARVAVLNARFQVLQEMLDMLRDHQNNSHASRLEWIIIWLLMVDVVLMLFQLLGIFGVVRNQPIHHPGV